MREGSLQRCESASDDDSASDDESASDAEEGSADDGVVDDAEDAASHDNAKSFACHVMEEVVRGRVTVKGVTDLLKIFHGHYGKLLPRHTKIPTSWYMISKLAREDQPTPPNTFRDVCPECDYLFLPASEGDPDCPRCMKATRWNERKVGEPKRQAVYFDLEHDIREFVGVEVMADALEDFALRGLHVGSVRDHQLDNAVDGTILRALNLEERISAVVTSDEEAAEVEDNAKHTDAIAEDSEDAARGSEGDVQVDSEGEDEEDQHRQRDVENEEVQEDEDSEEMDGDGDASKYTVFLALTADATDFASWSNKSFTPVTSKILNLDCALRSRMSNIQLHAILPESISDYNSLLRPVALQLHRHRPDGGRPIRVQHPRTGKIMHLYVHLAYTVNDLRGVPGCTGGCYAPCIEGSCVVCKVRGVYRQNRTIIPASVRALPRNSDLRRQWKFEFRKDTTLMHYADMLKPGRRLKMEALASAGRVVRKETLKKDEAFASVSVFSELLPYHDVTKHSKTDLAHTIANAVKLLFEHVTNSAAGGKAKFADRYKTFEVDQLKRFEYLGDSAKARYHTKLVYLPY
jgi:hypothetical protein